MIYSKEICLSLSAIQQEVVRNGQGLSVLQPLSRLELIPGGEFRPSDKSITEYCTQGQQPIVQKIGLDM